MSTAAVLPVPSPLAARVAKTLGEARGAIPAAHLEHVLGAPLAIFLSRPGKAVRGRLSELAFAAAGGRGDAPAEIALAIEAIHAGSLIVDDVEDGSDERRGGPTLHRISGVPLAINAGTWLYFHGVSLALSIASTPERRLAIAERANATLLRCHEGQALDLGVRAADLARADVLPVVREITARKTAALFSLATWLAATSAGASPEITGAFDAFGEELGTALQMMDDLAGLVVPSRRHKGEEDVRLGRATWAWAWASTSLGPRAFERLRTKARGAASGHVDASLVAGELARSVAATGRRAVRRKLDRAVATLVASVPPSSALDELSSAAFRMEALYG